MARPKRRALSARGVEREYGVDRGLVGRAIRTGQLPASRVGRRRYLVFRDDVEGWLRAFKVKPGSGDEGKV